MDFLVERWFISKMREHSLQNWPFRAQVKLRKSFLNVFQDDRAAKQRFGVRESLPCEVQAASGTLEWQGVGGCNAAAETRVVRLKKILGTNVINKRKCPLSLDQ